jgi:nodulation protein E
MRRVAITGVGAISSLGRTAAEFAESLRQGRPGIGPIESADMSQMRFQNGAEVKNYSHQPYFDDRRADFMDRFAQFAVIAAREAVEDSGVVWTPELRETAAIITGSCVGGQST